MYFVNKATTLYLGHQGENRARVIEIDISSLLELANSGVTSGVENAAVSAADSEEGAATANAATETISPAVSMFVMRNGDTQPYLSAATLNGNILIWPITNVETDKPGQGQVEIRLSTENSLIKSGLINTYVDPAMTVEEAEVPEAHQEWVEQVLATAATVQQSASDAQQAASEAKEAAASVDPIDDTSTTDQKTWSSKKISTGQTALRQAISTLSEAVYADELGMNDITDEVGVATGFYLSMSGGLVDYSSAPELASYTDYIPVTLGDVFFVTGGATASTTLAAFYDADKKFIRSAYNKNDSDVIHWEDVMIDIDDEAVAFVRFGSYQHSAYPLRVKRGVAPSFVSAYNGETLIPLVEKANQADHAAVSQLAITAESSVNTGVTNVVEALGNNAAKGTLGENRIVTVPITKETVQASDKGFSVKIGTRSSLRNKSLILKKKETLPYASICMNCGSIWGNQSYADIGSVLTTVSDSYYRFDFEEAFSLVAERCAKVEVDFEGDVYLMIFGNTAWDLTTIADGETLYNSYGVYAVENGFIYSDLIDQIQKDITELKLTAGNAKSVGIEKVHVVRGHFATGFGSENITVDAQHDITFTITNQSFQAGDCGAAFSMQPRADMEGHKILIRHEEAFPLSRIALGFNQGTGWGTPYYDVLTFISDYDVHTWVIDFDEAYAAAVASLGDKLPSTFDGTVYLMLYGNTDWDLATLADGEVVYNRYSVYLDDPEVLFFSPVVAEISESVKSMEQKLSALDNGHGDNILWGKKYVACGDSFTQGDFSGWTDENGLSGKNSPVIYDSVLGCYKTYPWWIAQRNNMTLVNEALCGSIMPLSKQYIAYRDGEEGAAETAESYRNPFSYQRYLKIPEDADYVTFWFGINDAGNTNLGTIDDTTNETYYGAWNMVLEWLITNRPYAKIGIIITNGSNANYRNATREVAKKWGIPYLDMMGDPQVPVIFGRETDQGLCSKANSLRRSSFIVTSSNGHPNLKAHEYESTFIEHFMRSL